MNIIPILALALTAAAPSFSAQPHAGDALSAVGPITNSFSSLGGPSWAATASPLLGNGDMGVCILGQSDKLLFMLGKNDFWHLKNTYNDTSALNFGHLSLALHGLNGALIRFEQRLLQAGTNLVAVRVLNKRGQGGISGAASLTITQRAEAPLWQRSTFNGWCQVIVAAPKSPGAFMLTATSPGMHEAAVKLAAE